MITLLISCFAAATLSAAEEDLSTTGCFASFGAEGEAEALRACLEKVVLTAQAEHFATSGNEAAARRLQKELEDRPSSARRLQGAAGSTGTFYWDHMKKDVLERELQGAADGTDEETPTQEWLAELQGDTAIDFCDRLLSHPEIELDCTSTPRLMLDGTHSTTVSFGAVDMVKAFGQLIMADFLTPGEVELFEPVFDVTTNTNVAVRDARKYWALDRMDGKMDGKFLQPEGQRGENVNIYLIDNGVQKDHKEFGGRAKEVPGWTSKYYGNHGTNCAGLAAGTNAGTAPKANLWYLNVFNKDGTSNTGKIPDAMRDAVTHCKKSGRRCVVSMSIGWGKKGSPSAIVDKRSKEIWESGMIFVMAAGNSGYDTKHAIMSLYKHNVVVGSSGQDDKLAFFSNYGDRVAIYAPGIHLRTATIEYSKGRWRPERHAYTSEAVGTSMSAPLVAGVLAGYLSANPKMSNWEVRKKLILDADRVPTLYLQREVACPVLADNHSNIYAIGKYFHVDLDCVQRAIGPFGDKGREVDVTVTLRDDNGKRHYENRHVIIWPRANGGFDGNAHGRIHPMSNARNSQWVETMLIKFNVSQVDSYFRAAKEGKRFWCDGTVVYGADKANSRSPGAYTKEPFLGLLNMDRACYQGCYTDDKWRDLRHRISGQHDVKSCRAKCSERGYAYFGVQYGNECRCDHTFGTPSRYRKISDDQCKRGGFPDGTGGAWLNSVYKTDCNELQRGDNGFMSLEEMTKGTNWLMWKTNHHVDDVCSNQKAGDPAFHRNKQCFCVRPYNAESHARRFPGAPTRAGPLIVANTVSTCYRLKRCSYRDCAHTNTVYKWLPHGTTTNDFNAECHSDRALGYILRNTEYEDFKAECQSRWKVKDGNAWWTFTNPATGEVTYPIQGSCCNTEQTIHVDEAEPSKCEGEADDDNATRDFCGCPKGQGWCTRTQYCSPDCTTSTVENENCAHL